jgi:hypothetical protein
LILVGVFAVPLALYATAAGFDFSYVDDDLLRVEDREFLEKAWARFQVLGRPYFADTGQRPAMYEFFTFDRLDCEPDRRRSRA